MLTAKVIGIAAVSVAGLATSALVGYCIGLHKQAEIDREAAQAAVDVTANKYEKLIDEMESKNTTVDGIKFHRFAASFINMNGDQREFKKFLKVLADANAITEVEQQLIFDYCTCGKMELEKLYAASKTNKKEENKDA
jgi:phosphoribulokinase